MIHPTPSKQVSYWPGPDDLAAPRFIYNTRAILQPCAAMIVMAHGDRKVNLVVWDQAGYSHSRPGVLLFQGDEHYSPVGAYCEWIKVPNVPIPPPPLADPLPMTWPTSYPFITRNRNEPK